MISILLKLWVTLLVAWLTAAVITLAVEPESHSKMPDWLMWWAVIVVPVAGLVVAWRLIYLMWKSKKTF